MKCKTNFFRTLLTCCLAALLFSGCLHLEKLKDGLNVPNQDLGYLHKAPVNNCVQTQKLKLTINGRGLNDERVISKEGAYLIPLLVVNFYTSRFVVTLGQDYLHSNYNDFLTNSLSQTLTRNTCVSLASKSADSAHYELQIDLNPPLVNSRVKMTTAVFITAIFWITTHSQRVFDSEARLSFRATLLKNKQPVFANDYSIKRSEPFPFAPTVSSIKANMAENLSQCTAEAVNKLISDISPHIK